MSRRLACRFPRDSGGGPVITSPNYHPGDIELPVFTCQAHVFTINPQTKKSWIPSSSKAVDVNFFYDSNKHCYRIISVEDSPTGKKVIINSTLTEKMTFKKTSQKFGQWADSKTGGVHGLGFNSEAELTEVSIVPLSHHQVDTHTHTPR
ncbi:unnamed protein product [Echinostoma caproni]|uniref:WH1 domain-containing protein n=1 Tax=Echinostoma caproni TaxID=27848 RepID=A0A183B8M4_9TREM|nr:unnamed protein product [Echinostoma caproni]